MCGLLLCVLGCGPEGAPRHEVTGVVRVDGAPAERVLVQLVNENEATSGDDRYPLGLTDSTGRFRIGSQANQPGAIEGSYRVLFSWLSSPDLDAVDRLEGRYADPATATDRMVRVPTDGELSFELTTAKQRR